MNINQFKELYFNTFNDDDAIFGEQLFSQCFNYCRSICIGEHPISMLFTLPCKLYYNSEEIDSYYVYAAATDIAYRKQGYMTSLLSLLLKEDKFIFLRPAKKHLIQYYSKLGFTLYDSTPNKKSCYVEPKDEFKQLVSDDLLTKNQYKGMYYYRNKIDINNIYFPYTME